MMLIAIKQVKTSVLKDRLTVGMMGIPRLRIRLHENSLITGKQ